MAFAWKALAGLRCRLGVPDRPSPDAPLLLGLHGRGSSPERLEGWAQQLHPGAMHLLPEGPYAWEGMAAWYLGRPAPEPEVATSREALLGLLDAALVELGVSAARAAVWGFSQGGMMSLELGLAASAPLSCVLCLSGNLYRHTQADPGAMKRAQGRRFVLIHGSADVTLLPRLSAEAAQALEAHGGRVERIELGHAHELTGEAIAAASSRLHAIFRGG